jgi:hypothetical protein
VSKAKAYQNEALWGRLLTLPIKTRLGWKGLPGTNTLALLIKIENYDRKKFYKIGPGLTDNRKEALKAFS